ncbi:MAG: BatA domain-containing protein, partial [Planctomycetota bacterium]|nr:BatA domain-containing protein [Planctomycetota bacterium]
MLGWLAAAAVPVLIHLWSRRRYREMSWAAMEYLLAAVRQSRRRLRVEHWLLLLIRTLVVVLAVLAVAEPYTATSGFSFAPGGDRTHRVLVIDGSFSMAYTPTDQSRFDRAKELAGRIVEESPQGDGFSLVLMSTPPVIVVSQPALEPGEFLQEIHNLTLPHATADLPATLAKVEEILVAARREHPRLIREEVYFLSDLGRVGWLPDFSNARAKREFHDRAERLAESAALVVIDLGQAGAENVAVTSVRTAASYVTLGRSVTVQAELKNFGRQNRDRQTVELLVDGRRVDSRQVDLPAGRADQYDASAVVTVIDTATHETSSIRLPTGATGMRGICVGPDGQYAYATHVLAHYELPTTQVEHGWMNANALSVIDARKKERVNTVLLDDMERGAANPWGVACSADGKWLCVAHAGTHEVSLINAPGLLEKLRAVPEGEFGEVVYDDRNEILDYFRRHRAALAGKPYGYDDGRPLYTLGGVGGVPNDLTFLGGLRRRIPLPGKGSRGLAV